MLARRARTVALCSIANLINSADRVIMPIAIIPMTEEYRWTLLWQGWILSAVALGYITSQTLASRASSRYGGRFVMICSVLLWSLSTMATPLVASSLPAVLLCRMLLGLGEGLGLPCLFQIVGQATVPEERPHAFSSIMTAGAVGQVIAALVCPHLAWPWMFYTFGGMGLVCVAGWLLLYRDDPTSSKEELIKPAQSLRWCQLLCWPLVAVYVAHFAMNWSSYTIMQWLPTYLARGLAAQPVDLSLTAVPYLCNSLGGVLTGRIADMLQSRRWSLLAVRRLATSVGLLGPGLLLLFFCTASNVVTAVVVISVAMGLLSCNSAGHLGNHADLASSNAQVTLTLSNTLVSKKLS